jgi:glycosyltransferase involved in cell wall biosynthesis
LRILIISPVGTSRPVGNAVSVSRLARALRQLSHQVLTVDAEDLLAGDGFVRLMAEVRPDIVHIYHAWRSGRVVVRTDAIDRVPHVVSAAGTDFSRDLCDPERGQVVRAVLQRAASIIVGSREQESIVRSALGGARADIRLVRKGVDASGFSPPPRDGLCRFLHPAGIRRIKNNLAPLKVLEPLARRDPACRVELVGPIIEQNYAEDLLAALRDRPFASYLGEVPHASMGALYERASVVLNTSLSEGVANAVLEGMAAGRPVLASRIPGNVEVVSEGESGLLYGDEDEFRSHAERLLADPALRARLGLRGREIARTLHSPAAEVEGVLSAYTSSLSRV